MDYPSISDYNAALTHPASAFPDPDLAGGTCQTGGMGLPAVLSGGLAYIYRVTTSRGASYAVRCFQNEDPRRLERYRAISGFLSSRHGHDDESVWAACELQPAGIEVNGERYPIVKMEWIEGETLAQYLESRHHDQTALAQLRLGLADLAALLEGNGVAHGDIQNGNILWTDDGLRLVDYDGMYLPGMEGTESGEAGHRNFQHPGYSPSRFGPTMDRFPFLVYDLCLRALEASPDLYETYSSGENALLNRDDLEDPAGSRALAQIAALPGMAQRAAAFARVCQGPCSAVPTLPDFERLVSAIPVATPITAAPARAPSAPSTYRGVYQVFEADDYDGITDAVGEMAEVVGRVMEVKIGTTKYLKPYVFLNFGNWREDIFKVTIWSEGLGAFRSPPGKDWIGQWVSVTGLVDEPYTSGRGGYTHTSITVHGPSQLKRIDADEAKYRLGRGARPGATAASGRPRRADGTFAPRQEPSWTPAGEAKTRNRELIEEMERKLAAARTPTPAPSAPRSGQPVRPSWQVERRPAVTARSMPDADVEAARRAKRRRNVWVVIVVVVTVVIYAVARG